MISILIAAAILFGPYQATPVRVIDGDTIEMIIEVYPGMYQRVNIRLDGVDTPETQSRGSKKITDCERKAGLKAKAFVKAWFADKKTVVVYDIHLGKYSGRALGKVSYNGVYLSDVLLRAGLAKPYDGGKRGGWCE